MLNDEGIAIIFEKRVMQATYRSIVIFTSSGNQGLYYINLQDNSALTITSILLSTDIRAGILLVIQLL